MHPTGCREPAERATARPTTMDQRRPSEPARAGRGQRYVWSMCEREKKIKVAVHTALCLLACSTLLQCLLTALLGSYRPSSLSASFRHISSPSAYRILVWKEKNRAGTALCLHSFEGCTSGLHVPRQEVGGGDGQDEEEGQYCVCGGHGLSLFAEQVSQ